MKPGIVKLSLFAIVSILMAGCQNAPQHNHAGHLGDGYASNDDVYYVDEADDGAVNLREERVFSYEYDSTRLTPEEVNDIVTYADRFLENPNAKVRMEGHTESNINY